MNLDTIIDTYYDYKECGEWGSMNTETGEQLKGGKMMSRTVKVRRVDGTIALESEWITDEDAKKEKQDNES